MINVIGQMLSKYKTTSVEEEKNAIKEVIQDVVLSGLAKAGFFDEAAFYGGTALRIFHGLQRFSEDLDFSLLQPDMEYDLSKYFPVLSKELDSWGINFTVEEKQKAITTYEQSAFVKGNTREHLMKFYPKSVNKVPYNEVIKIKFEVDTNPPSGFKCEFKPLLLPTPCKVRLFDMNSLFAGKIHAILCRGWARTKGRDLYDYLFFLSSNTQVNLINLKEKLVDSSFIQKDFNLTIPTLTSFLEKKFKTIDYKQAKDDVRPFIKDTDSLDLWDSDFFISATHQFLS